MPDTTYAINLFLDHAGNCTVQWARSRSSKPLYKHVQGKMPPSAGLHASGCPYKQLSSPKLRGRAVNQLEKTYTDCTTGISKRLHYSGRTELRRARKTVCADSEVTSSLPWLTTQSPCCMLATSWLRGRRASATCIANAPTAINQAWSDLNGPAMLPAPC